MQVLSDLIKSLLVSLVLSLITFSALMVPELIKDVLPDTDDAILMFSPNCYVWVIMFIIFRIARRWDGTREY